jgi:hypothetical protein
VPSRALIGVLMGQEQVARNEQVAHALPAPQFQDVYLLEAIAQNPDDPSLDHHLKSAVRIAPAYRRSALRHCGGR